MDHSNQHVIAICTRKECQKQSALCPKCIITFHQSCQENMIYLEELQTNMEKIESE